MVPHRPHLERSIRLDQPFLLLFYSIALIVPMEDKQTYHRAQKIPFRVLIIGRANAGKTTILQSVCETTESPVIYRRKGWKREEVGGPKYSSASLTSLSPTRSNLTRQSMLVMIILRLPLIVNHGASGANTKSTTNLCSLIIRVMSSTIPGELSQVALTNLRS